MDVIRFALKLLAGCLILFPFVQALGCSWIDHYFKTKLGIQAKIVNDMSDRLKKKILPKKKDEKS